MKYTIPLLTLALALLCLTGCNVDKLKVNPDVFVRHDYPIDRDQAKAVLAVDLPESMARIYTMRLLKGDNSGFFWFLRCDVPLADVEVVAREIIAWNNKAQGQSAEYVKSPLTLASIIKPDAEYQPVKWWDLSSATKGFYLAQENPASMSLRLWVDEENRRIYMYQVK